jgi:homocysteine S-methyltransferase
VDLPETIRAERLIITEGAVIERLRREHPGLLDPEILNAGFIHDPEKLSILKSLYREYIDLAWASTMPMLVFTPTWRATPERLGKAGLSWRDTISGCVRFLDSVRAGYGDFAEHILIGGLMGPKGDAYRPGDAIATDQAFIYHTPQAETLAGAGADFLMAATLPALSEAAGLARAMAAAGIPYVLSFVIRAEGVLLDGTPLHEAIAHIDATVTPRPTAYMLNCVHPAVARDALARETRLSPLVKRRLVGIQANTSRKSPEELDSSAQLDSEDPDEFARGMLSLRKTYGVKILGGCCGTDQRHIRAIIEQARVVT